MLAPKGFAQSISKEVYVEAVLTAQKKTGVLRCVLPSMLLAAAIALQGVTSLVQNGGQVGYLMTGIVMLCVAAVIGGTVLYVLPSFVRRQAQTDFDVYDALANHAQIVFDADELTVKSERLARRVEYAKVRLCVETAARFVLVTDDGAIVILEKACFEQHDETVAFLRDVFARWYAKGR